MAEIKEKTLSEVKQRLEKAMARLDKALMTKADSFDQLRILDKKKEEIEALEFNLITESKKRNQQVESIIKDKDEIISKQQKHIEENEKRITELTEKVKIIHENSGSETGKITSLERENELLRKNLAEEKQAQQNFVKISKQASEQLDLLINEVDKILADKIV